MSSNKFFFFFNTLIGLSTSTFNPEIRIELKIFIFLLQITSEIIGAFPKM